MRIFVTGGTGGVGSALVPKLIAAGHIVSVLTRSDASAKKASDWGATPVRGEHTSLDVLKEAVANVDAVYHLAFNHEISFRGGMAEACEQDRAAITAIGDALSASGSGKTLIYSSGTLHKDREDEEAVKLPGPAGLRGESELRTLSYANKGLRSIVVRFPPIVHLPYSVHPFITEQVPVAQQKGFVAYIDGAAWPSVHVEDLADLLVLALTKGPSGVYMHGTAEEAVSLKDIAEVMGKKLNLPTKSVSAEEALQLLGPFFGSLIAIRNKTTSIKTREWTGWEPHRYGLLQELEGYPSLVA